MRTIRLKPVAPTGSAPKRGMPIIEANVIFDPGRIARSNALKSVGLQPSDMESLLYDHLNVWQAERARGGLQSVPLSVTIHLYVNDYQGRAIDPESPQMVTMIRAQLDPILHEHINTDAVLIIFGDLVHYLCEFFGSRSGTIKCGPNVTRLDFVPIEFEQEDEEDLLGLPHGTCG